MDETGKELVIAKLAAVAWQLAAGAWEQHAGAEKERAGRLEGICCRLARRSGQKTAQIIELRQRAEAAERVVDAVRMYFVAGRSWREVCDAFATYNEERADA